MESGVYVLEFPDNIFYVGKSDNIPRRWEQHRNDFIKGKHTKSMQWAYDTYGMPQFRVHVYCHKDHIDLIESIIIHGNQDKDLLNGNKPSAVSPYEEEILLSSAEELKLSTAEHVSKLKDLTAELEVTTALYKELRATGLFLPEEVEEMPEQIEYLRLSVKHLKEDVEGLTYKLNKLRNRNLWERIFNVDASV